jgi:hypothetical protein
MNLRFPQRDEFPEAANLPAMAVDLGFASKKKSCGLAWQVLDSIPQTERSDFRRCLEKVAAFLSDNANSVLIVEAPLSGLFGPTGNPKGRTPFEKSCVAGRTSTRYWYVGAGAAVGLGAVFLFSHLSQLVTPETNLVHVVEGFVSFKTRRSNDKEDALALLNGLRRLDATQIYDIEATEGERCVNMLTLAGLAPQEDPCPAVMVVKPFEE